MKTRSGRGGYKPFLHGIARARPRGRAVRLPERRSLPQTLSLEQVAAVIDCQRRLRDRFLFALLASTGMRIGQALLDPAIPGRGADPASVSPADRGIRARPRLVCCLSIDSTLFAERILVADRPGHDGPGLSESRPPDVWLASALAFGAADRAGLKRRQSRGRRCVRDARYQDRRGAERNHRGGDDGCDCRGDDLRSRAVAPAIA